MRCRAAWRGSGEGPRRCSLSCDRRHAPHLVSALVCSRDTSTLRPVAAQTACIADQLHDAVLGRAASTRERESRSCSLALPFPSPLASQAGSSVEPAEAGGGSASTWPRLAAFQRRNRREIARLACVPAYRHSHLLTALAASAQGGQHGRSRSQLGRAIVRQATGAV